MRKWGDVLFQGYRRESAAVTLLAIYALQMTGAKLTICEAGVVGRRTPEMDVAASALI